LYNHNFFINHASVSQILYFAEKCQTLAWFATITKPDTNTDYIFLSVSTIYQDFLQKNLF